MRLLQYTVGMVVTNCYLLINEETREAAVVDPGAQAGYLLEECRRQELSLKAILLTHGHFDHIMAVPALQEATGARIYTACEEDSLLQDAEANLSGSWQKKPVTIKADVLLQDEEEFSLFGSRVRMLLTPGHTAGSCCYYLPKERWLFSGDTLFYENYGRIDLPTARPARIAESIREKLFALADDTAVYPGHGESTDIGHEKKYNPSSY